MKKILRFTIIVALVTTGYLTAGCQAISENNSEIATSKKEMLLTRAGFRARTVTTPKQQQQVSQLAENKVSAVKYKGTLYYVYPTTKKDQVLVGKQAQFDAYKAALQTHRASQEANQQAEMAAGDPVWVVETAGPRHITVETFDGFGPLNPMQGDE